MRSISLPCNLEDPHRLFNSCRQGFGSVACPQLGHPALSSDLLNYAINTEFVAAVGMPGKKITIESWNNIKIESQFTIV